jgi:hypothetical protein
MRKSIISGAVLLVLTAGCGAKEKDKESESKEVAAGAECNPQDMDAPCYDPNAETSEPTLTVDFKDAVAVGVARSDGASVALYEKDAASSASKLKKLDASGKVQEVFGSEWTMEIAAIAGNDEKMIVVFDRLPSRTVEVEGKGKGHPITEQTTCPMIEIIKADNSTKCRIQSKDRITVDFLAIGGSGEAVIWEGGSLTMDGEAVFPEITETYISTKPLIAGNYVLVSGTDSKGHWVKAIDSNKKPVKLASLEADWMISVDGIGYFQTSSPEEIFVDQVIDENGQVVTPNYRYKEVRIMKFQNGTTTEESFRKVQSDGTVLALTSEGEAKGLGAYKMGQRVVVLSQDGDALKLE